MIVAFGKAFITSYSPKNFVYRSSDGESGEAPAAEKWINLSTPGFFAAACANLLGISMFIYSNSFLCLTFFLGPIKFITVFEFFITRLIIFKSSKFICLTNPTYPVPPQSLNSLTSSSKVYMCLWGNITSEPMYPSAAPT